MINCALIFEQRRFPQSQDELTRRLARCVELRTRITITRAWQVIDLGLWQLRPQLASRGSRYSPVMPVLPVLPVMAALLGELGGLGGIARAGQLNLICARAARANKDTRAIDCSGPAWPSKQVARRV